MRSYAIDGDLDHSNARHSSSVLVRIFAGVHASCGVGVHQPPDRVGARWATNSALFQGPGLRMVEYSAIWIRHQCCLAQVALCDAFLDPDGCSCAAVIAPPTYLRGSLEFWPHRGARSGLVADGCTCSALRLSMSTLVGRTIIIGITTLEHDGSILGQAQK